MDTLQSRVLVVDDRQGTLSLALGHLLAHHDVETAHDAFDAIYRIDCTARPYDLIFCDLARGDLPGPELWAYLSLTRQSAAKRMVFVASGPLGAETQAFLAQTPNVCLSLPLDARALDTLAPRGSRVTDRPVAKPHADVVPSTLRRS